MIKVFKIGCTAFELLWTSNHQCYQTACYAANNGCLLTHHTVWIQSGIICPWSFPVTCRKARSLQFTLSRYTVDSITSVYQRTKTTEGRVCTLITVMCFYIYTVEESRPSSKNGISRVACYLYRMCQCRCAWIVFQVF